MSEMFKTNSIWDYVGALFFMAAFLGGILIFWQTTKTTNYVPLNRTFVACPSDLSAFADSMKKVTLLEDKPSNGTKGILKGYKVTIQRTGLTSSIACGYLLYRVSFGGKPIEQDYMTLVMNPTGGQFGGHLFPDETRGAIMQEQKNSTEVLIPLNKITFDGLTRNPIKTVDWAALLNVAPQIEFDIALSADVPDGRIDLVQIAYKCINKETGQETQDCDLEVTNTSHYGF